MSFEIVSLYEFKIKDLKTKKIGWLNYTNFKINIDKKKNCTAFKGDLSRDKIQEILKKNDYKILEIRKTTVLEPNR